MTVFSDLPAELKQKIFSFMPIRSLKNLQRVNEEWRNIIYGMRNNVAKVVDHKFRENEVKTVSTKLYHVEHRNLEVEQMSQDFVVLVTAKDTCLADSKVFLYNVKENSRLEVHYLTTELEKNCLDYFQISLNNNLLALNFFYKDTENRKDVSLVKLWSLTSCEKILEEEFNTCHHICTDSSKKMNILIVFHEQIEVICFKETEGQEPTFYRFSVNCNPDARKFGLFHYPFLTGFETNLSQNISRMFVWKVDGNKHKIKNIVSCPDKRYFAKYKDGSFIVEDFDNVIFVDDHFFSTSDIEQKHHVLGCEISSFDLAIRVYKKNGIMIQEIMFPEFTVHDELYCSFEVRHRKLFLGIEGDYRVFNDNLKLFYEEGDFDHRAFTKISHIKNDPNVVFQKMSIGSSYLSRDSQDNYELVYKKVAYF